LTDHDEVRERRSQARRPNYARPEIMATGPNQLWSWDITKLRGPTRGVWFFLYVMMDVFSRYVVGWLVAERESEALARELIDAACAKQGIGSGQLTLHADRGAPMTAGSVAQLLDRLGVNQSHSRPHVSNDNPYSEAGFRTVKYHPTFPGTFGSASDAYDFCGPYFLWCNEEHHHTGLALLTPATVHYGRTAAVLAERQAALDAAYAAHPERFVHGPPKAPEPPSVVWINPPPPEGAPDIEAPPAPALGQPGAQPESRAAVVGPAERTLDSG
jgi:putative transposase